ncbi:MAG: acyl-CoA dehydrogenase C-terminal domain-containing protein [Euryhalocaulis sp.]|uniref:acyl-CoA dehydrogenase family protein n=1 Tax=Euryhalocaulis sp. TaxID=2744307 RepID=UPI0017ABCE33|nr:acyl-CoA dehydrogenase C-terminal domain-containing protein [Euryhalocaulis sp.]MBA4801089.1 acyl-CoA dehydrogenase C-terminal domain-containing protein [Euryhalocaulis sp.]
MPYTAPVEDIRFSLEDVVAMDGLKTTGAFDELSRDLTAQILEEAGKFTADILGPLNRSGDQEGCTLKDGAVTTPKGFSDAYARMVEGGWQGLAAPAEHGGMGLPRALGVALQEMMQAANMAFGLCPMLTQGGIEALLAHGDEHQNSVYLPKLISGEWSCTMNLTEPQAGSDVGALRTKAEPNGDGSWSITGQKIYITWGEHDCTENVIHTVLARTPDGVPGTKGISLFLVPKFFVNEDGSLGDRNAVKAIGLEEKLGIHGSPTCTMDYAGAKGWLIGEEFDGMKLMFTMMNSARLNVGMQGVGVGHRAYQRALAYAQDRTQGRDLDGDYPAAIINHPDVRRMLMVMKAKLEAARHICLATAVAADYGLHFELEEDRKAAKWREDLLTPMAKAWGTDLGVEAASLGVQIHGGMGFIEESGAPQQYRDARIAPIYEGTNGIQAIDLVGRKLSMDGGMPMKRLIEEMRETVEDLETSSNEELPLIARRLAPAVDQLERTVAWLTDKKRDPEERLAGAYPFLTLASEVTGGYYMAIGAVAAQRRLKNKEGDPGFADSKVALARYYADSVLPKAAGHAAEVMGAADAMLDFPDEYLA